MCLLCEVDLFATIDVCVFTLRFSLKGSDNMIRLVLLSLITFFRNMGRVCCNVAPVMFYKF